MSPIIEVKKLVKKYGNFVAVNGVSFSVMEGEIFGLLGPNGAGKSTTMEIIETLIEKSSGSVIIKNFDIDIHKNEIKKIIGVQLQSCGYYPNLNLISLIKLFSSIYKVEAKPISVLKKVGLQEKANELYQNLSGGQKQRFTIATSLIHNPEILFLDEPTTGLDPQARRELWKLIREINNKGVTIIITTHYLEEAESLCDRLAIMNRGNIVALDTVDNLIKDLLNTGFKKQTEIKKANLEDVFINITGNKL